MPEFPIPLSPDDDQQTSLDLSAPAEATNPAYGYAAIMAGLVVQLILHGISLHGMSSISPLSALLQLSLSIVGGVCVYFALIHTRPQLSVHTLSVVAGELGFLFSYPAYLLYFAPWQSVAHTFWSAVLLFCAGLVGIVSTIMSHWLQADEDPRLAILTNFLVFFVLTGLGCLILT